MRGSVATPREIDKYLNILYMTEESDDSDNPNGLKLQWRSKNEFLILVGEFMEKRLEKSIVPNPGLESAESWKSFWHLPMHQYGQWVINVSDNNYIYNIIVCCRSLEPAVGESLEGIKQTNNRVKSTHSFHADNQLWTFNLQTELELVC